MNKILYFRIGADTSSPGSRGPVFKDGTFEYIPIGESELTTETRTYGNMIGRNGNPFSTYVGHANTKMHYDPEFEIEDGLSVYGDAFDINKPTGKSYYKKFTQLQKGDIIAFYTGLDHWPKDDSIDEEYYFIGYIEVDEVIESNINNMQQQPSNAHKKRFLYIMNIINEFNKTNEVPDTKEIDIEAAKQDLIKNDFPMSKSPTELITPKNWKKYKNKLKPATIWSLLERLMNHYARYILVTGSGRLFKKALKFATPTTSKPKKYIPVNEWVDILGKYGDKDHMRKNLRYIPDLKNNTGDVNLFKELLINQE